MGDVTDVIDPELRARWADEDHEARLAEAKTPQAHTHTHV